MKAKSIDHAPVEPLVRVALKDQIAASIENEILSGTLAPGQRLVERDLALRFGVSSIPVREALQDLELRGLVVKKHNHGCTVIDLTPEQAAKACAVRRLLEPAVIGWAARKLDPDQARALKQRLATMRKAAASKSVPAFFRQDMLLHRLLWEIADNEFAIRALQAALGSLFASSLLRAQKSKTLNLQREVSIHARLVKAVLEQDPQEAERIARDIAATLEDVSQRGSTSG